MYIVNKLTHPTIIYYDNKSAISTCCNCVLLVYSKLVLYAPLKIALRSATHAVWVINILIDL